MNRRHETSDMDPKYALYFAAALVIGAFAAFLGIWWLLRGLEAREARNDFRPTMVETPAAPPPEPRLQISPTLDYEAQRKLELETLSSYGWVEKEKGIARIPIERAMEILVERGVK